MNFEVIYGEVTYYINASNPYQACILALDEHLSAFDNVVVEPFRISNLSNGYVEDEVIGLSEILAIRNLSADCVVENS